MIHWVTTCPEHSRYNIAEPLRKKEFAMLIVHVHVQVKPESVADFITATQENARNSVQEPGIARFDAVQQDDDPARHKETAHYQTLARYRRGDDGCPAQCCQIQPHFPG
jgi:hypothetical protein